MAVSAATTTISRDFKSRFGREFNQVAGEVRRNGCEGISREVLYRSSSPKGNPTLKTLLAVLKSMGMRLSVEPENSAHA
jgi:DNA-binding phage protein